MRLKIEIQEPRQPPRAWFWDATTTSLTPASITRNGQILRVGRTNIVDGENGILLADHTVSRMHAIIEMTEDVSKIRVIDLGSTFGTFIDQPIRLIGQWQKIHDAHVAFPAKLRFGERSFVTISGTLN